MPFQVEILAAIIISGTIFVGPFGGVAVAAKEAVAVPEIEVAIKVADLAQKRVLLGACSVAIAVTNLILVLTLSTRVSLPRTTYTPPRQRKLRFQPFTVSSHFNLRILRRLRAANSRNR